MQLVAKGILPPDDSPLYPLGTLVPPASASTDPTSTTALSGASLNALKQLADKLAEGLNAEALLAQGPRRDRLAGLEADRAQPSPSRPAEGLGEETTASESAGALMQQVARAQAVADRADVSSSEEPEGDSQQVCGLWGQE